MALGKNSVSPSKQEGDSASPADCFPLRRVHYRVDRLATLATALETPVIRPTDGWSSNPGHDDYNRPVTLPHGGDMDRLRLEDTLCDLVVESGTTTTHLPLGLAMPSSYTWPGTTSFDRRFVVLRGDDLLEILGGVPSITHLCSHTSCSTTVACNTGAAAGRPSTACPEAFLSATAGSSPPPTPDLTSRTRARNRRLSADGSAGFCDRRRYRTSTPLRWRPPPAQAREESTLLNAK